MMTKSKLLLSEAIGNLDCTEQERADIREHLRDNDINGIYSQSCAEMVAEMMLEKIRETDAEDTGIAMPPKWNKAYHTSQGCQAFGCTNPATWQIDVEAVPGIMFTIKACSKHAGKEDETQ